MGKPLASESFINFLGEEKYKPLVNFILHYVADLDIPIKRLDFPPIDGVLVLMSFFAAERLWNSVTE